MIRLKLSVISENMQWHFATALAGLQEDVTLQTILGFSIFVLCVNHHLLYIKHETPFLILFATFASNPVCRAWQLHAQDNLQQIESHPKNQTLQV